MLKIMADKFSSNNSSQYDQYLRKIWVLKSWDDGSIYQSFSFIITEIKDGLIVGKISPFSIAEPDVYFKNFKLSNTSGILFGRINNSLAKCYLSDRSGIIGNMDLILKEKNEIEAAISEYKSEANKNDIVLEGIYTFRPYKLSDIKFFSKIKKLTFSVDLNSWGRVNFVSGEISTGKGAVPAAFLTNDQDEIFYCFKCDFEFNSRIADVTVRDINNDGLKDVVISTAYMNQQFFYLRWIFLQKDNGYFYDTSRDAKSV